LVDVYCCCRDALPTFNPCEGHGPAVRTNVAVGLSVPLKLRDAGTVPDDRQRGAETFPSTMA